jgi:hypothetical protein
MIAPSISPTSSLSKQRQLARAAWPSQRHAACCVYTIGSHCTSLTNSCAIPGGKAQTRAEREQSHVQDSTAALLAYPNICAILDSKPQPSEDKPTIKAVNPTSWIKKTDYREQEFKPSLQAFTTQRAGLLAVLKPLAPDAWSRMATVAGKPRERTVYTYPSGWQTMNDRISSRSNAS